MRTPDVALGRLLNLFLAAAALAVGTPAAAQRDGETGRNESASRPRPSDDPDANPLPRPPTSREARPLSDYLTEIASRKPAEATPKAVKAHIENLHERVDEVLARKVPAEVLRAAAGLKFSFFTFQKQLGVGGAEARRDRWLVSLTKSDDGARRRTGQGITVMRDLQSAVEKSDAQNPSLDTWEPVINGAATLLKESKADSFSAEVAMQVAEQLETYGDPEWAAPALKLFAGYYRSGGNERMEAAAQALEAKAGKLSLPGSEMKITGTTLGGEPFTLEEMNGKVVLVDFWATWCGFCIEAFPTLKEAYAAHSEEGFEIVGVNLDDSKALFADYLKDNPLPWTHVQNLGDNGGPPHPNAERYGVTGIPFMVLVGRDGKVVKINVKPDEVEALVSAELAKPETAGGDASVDASGGGAE